MNLLLIALTAALCGAESPTDVNAGPIAHYTFDEGSGDVLHDRTGHGHDGTITGAQWAQQDGRASLQFRGRGDYVDFGDDRDLKVTGDWSFTIWFRLDASPYPDDATNWTLVDCEAYRKEGFLVRIDGAASTVLYRANRDGADHYGSAVTAIDNHSVHCVAVTRHGDVVTIYVDGKPDAEFPAGGADFGGVPFRISSAGQSFSGAIYEVAFFSRALQGSEVAGVYWQEAERYRRDVAQRGQLYLKPFVYPEDKEARAVVDFFGVMPLEEGERISVGLLRHGGETLVSKDVAEIPKSGAVEYAFPLDGLADGEYELRAVLNGPHRTVVAGSHFDYPAPPITVPAPETFTVPPLPIAPPAPSLDFNVTPGGGASLTVGGTTYLIESAFSFPNGDSNFLACGDATDKTGEPEWKPASRRIDLSTWEIDASGKFYSLSRKMKAQSERILVSDTLTNRSAEPVGIVFHNRLGLGGAPAGKVFLVGTETSASVGERELRICPTIFLSNPALGVGLVALDDVYIVQSLGSFDEKRGIDLFSKEFALDAGASYTIEWAIYANATGDYYDFINSIRRDEGRNNVTVRGGFAFIPGSQQKRDAALVPTAQQYYDVRNLRYLTSACLSWCTDDPEISIEGIDFAIHPHECQRIREMMAAMKATRPEVMGMFHIAHQLYATNHPDDSFSDSRVLDAEGKQTVYPNDYGRSSYFSKQRADDNWRWWIYYPTLENSFGKAMLDSVDVMMDQLGCRGVFADGFLWGYGGLYSYDRWDGHTADIDPATHTIQRKKASILLVTQDAMIAWCRKIWDKGGVVIANGIVPTRTIGSLPLITDKEVTEGPDVPLLPTPITLSNPGACRTEQEVYQDVLNKLRWGNLYFYYGEPATLTYESVPARMYPITVQEVHSGYVKGKERLVTTHSGVYGWPDSRDLHMVYRYDSRGHRIRPGFVTTINADSVRTQIELADKETAIIERISAQMESSEPCNVIVERCDKASLTLTVNGKGNFKLIAPNAPPQSFDLDGQREISIPGPSHDQ